MSLVTAANSLVTASTLIVEESSAGDVVEAVDFAWSDGVT